MADAPPASGTQSSSRTAPAGAGHRPWSLTSAYYLAFVSLGLTGAVLGPTLPGLASQTETSLGRISLLFTAMAVGYLAGSLLAGRLYDRIPGNPLMAAGLLVMATTLAATPLVPWLSLLIPVMVLLGAAQGAVDVGGNALLVWVHGARVGPFMNGLHFFWGLGALLSPIIVGAALSSVGEIAPAFWTLALLLLPVAAWVLRLSSPQAPTDAGTQKDPSEAGSVTPGSGLRTGMVVVMVTLLLFLFVGVESGYGGWIYSYTLALNVGSRAAAIYLTTAFWGSLTLGRLLAIPIAGRVRPRWILLVDAIGCLVSAGILLLWPRSVPATWTATIGMGLFMASVFPTAITLAGRRIVISGRVAGWFLVGASIGGMTLPFLMGQLFDSIGPQSAMVLLAAYLVLALVVLTSLLFYRERGLSIH